MNTSEENRRTNDDKADGVIGFFRNSFRTGMGAVESIHQQFAAEIPLGILEAAGVSKETTAVAREKHRQLLRGIYGTIDSIAGQIAGAGSKQVSLLSDAVRKATSGSPAGK